MACEHGLHDEHLQIPNGNVTQEEGKQIEGEESDRQQC